MGQSSISQLKAKVNLAKASSGKVAVKPTPNYTHSYSVSNSITVIVT